MPRLLRNWWTAEASIWFLVFSNSHAVGGSLWMRRTSSAMADSSSATVCGALGVAEMMKSPGSFRMPAPASAATASRWPSMSRS